MVDKLFKNIFQKFDTVRGAEEANEPEKIIEKNLKKTI